MRTHVGLFPRNMHTKGNKERKWDLGSDASASVRTEVVEGWFDGLNEPRNPGGYACGGWYVAPVRGLPGFDGPMEGCRCYGHGPQTTNNKAEYEAALDCLRAIYRAGHRGPVLLRGDSQLVVKQFTGEWACNAAHLQGLLAQLRRAATFFESLRLEWVPRDENAHADALSRQAYEQARRGAR